MQNTEENFSTASNSCTQPPTSSIPIMRNSDGSGYPRGLKADNIPVGARCFAIVDAIDAMIFKRPYNEPVTFDVAAAEIQRCACKHFDPDIVGTALDFLSSTL